MTRTLTSRILLGTIVSFGTGGTCWAFGPQEPPPKLCSSVVTTLSTDAWSVPRRANVVEIRRCGEGLLQLVAWGSRQKDPLVVDTNHLSIVSLVTASDSVFVIETAGASSNTVQAIVFEKGMPRLAMDETGRAYAEVCVSWKTVVVRFRVPGEPIKVVTLPTGIE